MYVYKFAGPIEQVYIYLRQTRLYIYTCFLLFWGFDGFTVPFFIRLKVKAHR